VNTKGLIPVFLAAPVLGKRGGCERGSCFSMDCSPDLHGRINFWKILLYVLCWVNKNIKILS